MTRSGPLLSEKRAEEEAGREREQVHRRSSFLGKNMKEKEALLLVDEFPGWVSELLWESASGVREGISLFWFEKTQGT